MEPTPQAVHERGGPGGTPPPRSAPHGAPGVVAQQVARLWGEYLNGREVGVEDDFFALGGNSLTGIKIIDRVAQDFGVRLSVRDFYLAQTPARVAELIERERGRAGT